VNLLVFLVNLIYSWFAPRFHVMIVPGLAPTCVQDAELKELQKTGGTEAMEKWNQMRAEGKLMASDDMQREAGERSLGGEGLIADRIDEQLPYIDSGYVDDSQPDIMGAFGKLFGGDDKKKK
jgi:hypothetical protein